MMNGIYHFSEGYFFKFNLYPEQWLLIMAKPGWTGFGRHRYRTTR
ncbi:Uncharacterised protein [Salmonella bongori]|nr:Uncharacterised protein [Salmonella bongori]